MALVGKLETTVDIKSSAENFFNFLSSECHVLPNVASDKVKGVAIHEGEWHASGSIKHWKFNIGGQVEDFKERVEIDKENKLTSHTVLEGQCLSLYRSYRAIFQVIPKREGGSVKITLEYEKLNQNIPPPKKYLDFIVHVFKDADAHLLQS